MPCVINFGTFDLPQLGHVASSNAFTPGDHLILDVSSDELNLRGMNPSPMYPIAERLASVKALRYADEVFMERSLAAKREHGIELRAGIPVMRDDWVGQRALPGDVCRLRYLPHGGGIASTNVEARIRLSV